jgi:heme exporter protein D
MSAQFAEYFAMGGYGVFIWPSYALAVLLLAVVFVLAARRLQAATRALGLEEDDGTESEMGEDAGRRS